MLRPRRGARRAISGHTHTHTPCGIGGVYRVFTKLAETPGDDQLGVGNSALPPLRRRRRRRNSKTKKKKERRNETCRRRPLKRRPVREREREKKCGHPRRWFWKWSANICPAVFSFSSNGDSSPFAVVVLGYDHVCGGGRRSVAR